MSIAIQSDIIYTPMMINDVFATIKSKTIDVKDKVLLQTSVKLMTIARDEISRSAYHLEQNLEQLTIEDIKSIHLTKMFIMFDNLKDKLNIIYEEYENSTEPYEVVLFDVVDETLDHIASVLNMLNYLSSKIIRENFKVA